MQNAASMPLAGAAMHRFMSDIGIHDDPVACTIFLNRLKHPMRPYVDSTESMRIKNVDRTAVEPWAFFLNCGALLADQTIFPLQTKIDALHAQTYATYYGAVPALDEVASYYIGLGKIPTAKLISSQMHFWQQFANLCAINARHDSSSPAFHSTVATVVSLAAQILPQSHAAAYKHVVQSLKDWLEQRVYHNDLIACAHLAHLSSIPKIYDGEHLEQAMRKILTLVDSDQKRLEFIIGNNLKHGLELLAQKDDIVARSILSRYHFCAGNWQLASKYADGLKQPEAEIVVMSKIAHLMRTIEPALNNEQFAQELHQIVSWFVQEIATNLSDPIIKLFASHCPDTLLKAVENCAEAGNSDAHVILGYLNMVMTSKKDNIHCAFSHFVDAATNCPIDEKQPENQCARWLTITLVNKYPTLFNEREKNKALDLCFELADSESLYHQQAHDLLIKLSKDNNEMSMAAKMRSLMLLLTENSLEEFYTSFISLANNELSGRQLLVYFNRSEIQKMVTSLKQSDDKRVQQKAIRISGFIEFAKTLSKDSPWPIITESDLIKTIELFVQTESYSETELTILRMISDLATKNNTDNKESLEKSIHEIAAWFANEIGHQFQHPIVDFFITHCPDYLMQKINGAAQAGNSDANILVGYCIYKTDKNASYEHFAVSAKSNDFAKWAAITIAQDAAMADKTDQIIEWCAELASCVSSAYKTHASELLATLTGKNIMATINHFWLLIENDPHNLFLQTFHALHDNENAWQRFIEFCKQENTQKKISEYKKWTDSSVQARAYLIDGYIKLMDSLREANYSTALELGEQAYSDVQRAVNQKCGSREELAEIALNIAHSVSHRNHDDTTLNQDDTAEKWYKCSLQHEKLHTTKRRWAQKVLKIADAQIKTKQNKRSESQRQDLERAIEIVEKSEGADLADYDNDQLKCFEIFYNDTYGLGQDLQRAYEHLNNYFKNHANEPKIAFILIIILAEAREKGLHLPLEKDCTRIYELCKLAWQNTEYQTLALKKELALAAYKTDRCQEADDISNLIPQEERVHCPELIYNRALSCLRSAKNKAGDNEKKDALEQATWDLVTLFLNYLDNPQENEKNLKICTIEEIKFIKEALKDALINPNGLPEVENARRALLSLLTLLPQAQPMLGKKANAEIKQALLTLEQEAQTGELGASIALSYFYRVGKFVPQDLEISFSYLKKIIEHDNRPFFLSTATRQFASYAEFDTANAMKIYYQMVEIFLSDRYQEIIKRGKVTIEFEKQALAYFFAAEVLLWTKYRNLLKADFIKGAFDAVKKLADSGNLEACSRINSAMQARIRFIGLEPELAPDIDGYVHKSLEYLEKACYGTGHFRPTEEDVIEQYVNLANLYIESKPHLAIEYIVKTLKLDPKNVEARYLHALYLLKQEGDSEKAISNRKKGFQLLQTLADVDNCVRAQYTVGLVYTDCHVNPLLKNLVPLDIQKGLHYVDLAADQHFLPAEEMKNERALALKSRLNPIAANRFIEAKLKRELKMYATKWSANQEGDNLARQTSGDSQWRDRVDAAKGIASLYSQLNKLNECLAWLDKIIDDPTSSKSSKQDAAAEGALYCLRFNQMEKSVEWLKKGIQHGIVDEHGNFHNRAATCQDIMNTLINNPRYKKLVDDLQKEIQKASATQIQVTKQPAAVPSTEATQQAPAKKKHKKKKKIAPEESEVAEPSTNASTMQLTVPATVQTEQQTLAPTIAEAIQQQEASSTAQTEVTQQTTPVLTPDVSSGCDPIPLINFEQEFPRPSKEQLIQEINEARDLIQPGMCQALTLAHDNKLSVVGDTHGGHLQLTDCINKMRAEGCFEKDDCWKLTQGRFMLLSGDIADRDLHGIETWRIVFKLLKHNPKNLIILKGNHETRMVARTYGLYDEVADKYGRENPSAIFEAFIALFDKLSSVLLLGMRKSASQVPFFFCCHGLPDRRISPQQIIDLAAKSRLSEGKLISCTDVKSMLSPTYTICNESSNIEELFSPQNNGLIWSDMCESLDNGENFEWGKLRHGAPGYQITFKGIQELLHSYSTPEAPFIGVLRGHEHTASCVNIFDPIMCIWKPITAKQIIERGSIFTFMCLSPCVPPCGEDNKAGYGLIEFDEESRLTITPQIASSNMQCIRSGGDENDDKHV